MQVWPVTARVRPGIDVLIESNLGAWHRARLGLLCGASGVTSSLMSTAGALWRGGGARLVCLFATEHGLRGDAAAGELISSGIDTQTGLPVYSLYGDTREPTAAMLASIDAVLVDVQDVGLRYYTYPSTLHAVLRAAARHACAVVVLDRPAPLTGNMVEGPVTERAFQSFVSTPITPIRHGLTLGELARWMNDRDGIGADLHVVPMRGWRRTLWFDETGLAWVPPSPNIPTLASALAYTATCLIEGTPLSEGRGTTQPFEILGAPWVQGDALAEQLNVLNLPGVRFRPVWFRPSASKHAHHTCVGVQMHVLDRRAFAGVRTGLHVLAALWRLHPDHMTWTVGPSGRPILDLLLGTDVARLAIERGEEMTGIADAWYAGEAAFHIERASILVYEEERP